MPENFAIIRQVLYQKGNGIVLEHIYTLLLYMNFNFDDTQNAGDFYPY